MARSAKPEDSTPDPRLPRTRVHAGTLADGLKDVLGVVASKDVIPILQHVLVQAIDGRIVLTGTDLDIWVHRDLASDMSGEADSAEWKAASRNFGMTVAAKALAAVLGEIDPDAMVTVTAPHGEETRALVQAGRARFKLPVLPLADFPLLPIVEQEVSFDLKASALGDAFARTGHAVSSEETRYYLNGIYVHAHQDEGEAASLRFAATDGHRLARLVQDMPVGGHAWPALIVGRHTVALLDKLLAGALKANEEAMVAVTAGGLTKGSKVRFDLPAADGGAVTLVAKTVDGDFPDYSRVIPASPPLRVEIARAELIAAVKRVATLAHRQTRIVSAEFDADSLTLRASCPDLGEAVEELPCAYAGAPITVGFDSKYLRDALLAVGADEVALCLTDPGAPVRVEAVASDGEVPALVQVVMPVRV